MRSAHRQCALLSGGLATVAEPSVSSCFGLLGIMTLDGEIVERRDTISLRPEPNLAWVFEGVIVSLKQALVVEEHCKVLSLYFELQCVPLARRHFCLYPCELL